MKILLIAVSLFLLIFFYTFYHRKRMVFSPASLFSIIWLLLISAFLVFDDEVYPYYGIIWLLFAIVIVNVGQMVVTSDLIRPKKVYNQKIIQKETRNKKIVLVFLCAFLIIYSGIGYFRSGGVSNVASVAADYYTNTETETSLLGSLWEQLYSFLIYISGFIGGSLFKLTKKRSVKVLSFLPLVTPIIMMLTSSGKLGVIIVVITFAIGYIVTTIQYYIDFKKRQFILLFKRYWIFIPIIIVLFTVSLALRMGGLSDYIFSLAFNKMKSYAFGSPAAFNAWFTSNEGFDYGFGKNTFLGLFRLFGAERVQGVYQTLVVTNVWSTNVYTAFRGIIEDFGYFGSFLFLFLVGMVFGVSYKAFSLRKKSLSFWVLANSYLFVFYSFIISPFVYLNLSVLFLLYLIARYFIRRLFVFTGGFKRERNHSRGRQWNPSLSTDNGNK